MSADRPQSRPAVPHGRLPWGYILKRTLRSFGRDTCADLAAGLTYFGVLALFPALIALVSVLGLVGQSKTGIDALFGMADQLAPGMLDIARGPIEALSTSPATGWGLALGIVGALWSASGYVGGLGRALNRVYGVEEGRSAFVLRPVQLGVTVAAVALVAVVAVVLVVSGPIAGTIGGAIGLGDAAQTAWEILRWPVVAVALVALVALLYSATPNVKRPGFRWVTAGSFTAIVLLGVASVLFAFYVANIGSYDKTYGALAGVIVFLLWIWIANVALLLGAELDSEIERARQLIAGEEAERRLLLPLKSDAVIAKARDAEAGEILAAREIRRRNRGGGATGPAPSDADG
ncbi:hypothetical protein O159_00590 [Leifsonia xyli subsp. cynodontis DSM 46306]|uniref:Uncharacterized protein n=1 Tax=Leifsonia xyli subsp. cynodontis DSM 46306 TaxID=1389489 RepID=U3PA48_LEIXC|nr:YihY/virulence factor BrkB family protein [Leifsonia xyli]AGW40333.1 hypothetical protein O159_00590 [Leifsonia xyli subsp. cynodontis DSM 46306]